MYKFSIKEVSDWTLTHLQLLNIHYDNDFLPSPLSVLNKISGIKQLTDEQNRYLEIAKYYLPNFDINIPDDLVFDYVRCYKSELDSLLRNLESDDKSALQDILYGTEENMRDITEEAKQSDAKM